MRISGLAALEAKLLHSLIWPNPRRILRGRYTAEDVARIREGLQAEERAAPALLWSTRVFDYDLRPASSGIAIDQTIAPLLRRSITIQNRLDLVFSVAFLLMFVAGVGAADDDRWIVGVGILLYPAGWLVAAVTILTGSWTQAFSIRRRIKKLLAA